MPSLSCASQYRLAIAETVVVFAASLLFVLLWLGGGFSGPDAARTVGFILWSPLFALPLFFLYIVFHMYQGYRLLGPLPYTDFMNLFAAVRKQQRPDLLAEETAAFLRNLPPKQCKRLEKHIGLYGLAVNPKSRQAFHCLFAGAVLFLFGTVGESFPLLVGVLMTVGFIRLFMAFGDLA